MICGDIFDLINDFDTEHDMVELEICVPIADSKNSEVYY